MLDNCPFCDSNLLKQRILWEDDLTITFLANPYLLPGHTLVTPKRHIEKPWELTQAELQAIFKNIWKVEQRIITSGLATGCDVRQNYRPFMKQSRVKIDHTHFHILPRTLSDDLFQTSMQFEDYQDLDESVRQEVEKLLKS